MNFLKRERARERVQPHASFRVDVTVSALLSGGIPPLSSLTGRTPAYIGALDVDQPGVPPTDFGGPLGKGVPSGTALYMGRVKPGRSCRTLSTLQYHSPEGCFSDCHLQLHCITH